VYNVLVFATVGIQCVLFCC